MYKSGCFWGFSTTGLVSKVAVSYLHFRFWNCAAVLFFSSSFLPFGPKSEIKIDPVVSVRIQTGTEVKACFHSAIFIQKLKEASFIKLPLSWSKVELCYVSLSYSSSIYLIISVSFSHILFLCFLTVLVSKVVVNLF